MWRKFTNWVRGLNKIAIVFFTVIICAIATVGTVSALEYTDSPEFCATCHIMEGVEAGHLESSHAALSCNDCHLPHDSTVGKYAYKAKVGLTHIYNNTINKNHIPNTIHATASTKDIVQANCISCHETTLQKVSHNAKDSCVSCHRQLKHENLEK